MSWNPRPVPCLRLWRGLGHLLLVLGLVVALLPALPGVGRVAFGDKILHAGAFAFLMLWYAQIYPFGRERWRIAGRLILFGAGIEILQSLVPYRSADAWDLLADAAGVALGALLAHTRLGHLLSRFETQAAA
ncbi:MAG: VanZ family protein [Rhodanobacteraceae bacterium]|nr:VanZ family protein [Rhodanobacteraceae bacterium]